MAKRRPTTLLWTLVVACAVLFIADAFLHKHGAFAIERLFGFFAVFGFLACAALILVARWARTLLQRPQDYYDGDDQR